MIDGNIVILGSRGMLGQMVKIYFSNNNFNVEIIEERFNEQDHEEFIEKLNSLPSSIIVNCIGKIKQKSTDSKEFFLSNTILPLELARSLKTHHLLIHPSTDCVFDGLKQGLYNYDDQHTAKDVYGWSKSLGETAVLTRENTIIFRVSIIGTDIYSDKGLLAWFLSNPPNSKINGYTNHYWNGITTLEWCKKLHVLIKSKKLLKNALEKKIIQLGSKNIYSKYQILMSLQDIYGTNHKITPYQTSLVNRCLNPMMVSKPLELQLAELSRYGYNGA